MSLLNKFGNGLDKLSDALSGKSEGVGKNVNNYKYYDKNKPGLRKTDSRLRDVYDESNRQAYNDPETGQPDPMWWVWSALWMCATWFAGFKMLPSLKHVFPFSMFITYSINLKTSFYIIMLGIIVGACTMGFFYLNRQDNQIGHKEGRKLIANDVNDSHIARPDELAYHYDIVPDNKAHFNIDVTSLLSHLMIKSAPGLHGKDGNVKFDNKFSQELFDVASLPHNRKVRELFDAAQLPYNPNDKFGKNKGATVKATINNSWHVPDYEDPDSQNPSGGYIVSTYPENTVLIAETRGGKGQKYIEPILDVWSRQDKLPNIVVTDLKMELLRMNLKTFTIRGYNVKSLNLLVDSKTDAINFLGYAVDEAIRGNITEMESRIEQVANVFFPKDSGGQDPFWNNSAASVFKRTAYGLIEYYSEQVKQIMRDKKLSNGAKLQQIDEAWGRVTLYNAYQFIVQLAAKSLPRESFERIYRIKENGDTTDPDPDADSKSELSIYFDAVDQLPINAIREKISNQNKALQAGAKSEKMMASIYSICLFGMIFFTDNKIIKLTSARPSQNLDLTGFAFPRRLAVRFDVGFAERHNLVGQVTNWQVFHDPEMKQPYYDGSEDKPDYSHYFYEGSIDDYRWADSFFEGKFDDDKPAYIKLVIYDHMGYEKGNPDNLKLYEFNFEFKKGYRKSYSGRVYLHNPQTGEREVQGGVMNEYTYDKKTKRVNYIQSTITRKEHSLILDENGRVIKAKHNIISNYDIHYTDKPMALFLVAPPNTASYNKVLLITIDMLYNQQVATGFTAFSNQKPLYYTKYLLDEFGNMQSGGKGVPDLNEKLTSGLGSNQQFTMVLQSLSQLKTIYGDQAPTLIGNAQKYFFMKSKDKDLIKQLMDMNGKIHVIQDTSVNFDKPAGGYHMLDNFNDKAAANRPHVSTTTSRDERPVINENDYLRLTDEASDGNAIVSTGLDPIWSQGSTIMPMSYKLLANRTGGKGGDIIPQNLPTIADTTDFDPLQNMPDFDKMLAQRMDEAEMAPKVVEQFKKVEHVTDNDIRRMDAETYADRIMAGIHDNLNAGKGASIKSTRATNNFESNDNKFNSQFDDVNQKKQDDYTDKILDKASQKVDAFEAKKAEIRQEILRRQRNISDDDSLSRLKRAQTTNKDFDSSIEEKAKHWRDDKVYLDGRLTQSQLITNPLDAGDKLDIASSHGLDVEISMALSDCYANFNSDPHFKVDAKQNITFNDGSMAAENKGRDLDASEQYVPSDKFMIFLAENRDWSRIAGGRFKANLIHALNERAED